MKNKNIKMIGLLCSCMIMAAAAPQETQAALRGTEIHISTKTEVSVDAADQELYAAPDENAEVVGSVEQGNLYTVLEQVDDTWVRISVDGTEGYLNTKTSAATVAETAEKTTVDLSAEKRSEIVDYALQFIGGRYVYGGSNPRTGVDCSGFTAYIMRQIAGISLAHSSQTQATQGRSIGLEQIRPGDLVFYARGKRINHVAMYIGDGQVIHASNPKNGIRITALSYRNPVRVVNVLGD